MCSMHVFRKQNGIPMDAPFRVVLPAETRFWQLVDKTGDCWLWTGTKLRGYGRFRDDAGMVYAHRYAYSLAHGGIPKGLELDHLCRNRSCVRVEHLEAVTRSVNVQRGVPFKTRHCPTCTCHAS